MAEKTQSDRGVHQSRFLVRTSGRGTVEITDRVAEAVRDAGLSVGTAHVFCRHTSCSLVLMENADPSARRDLEAYFDRLVPEGAAYFTHTAEGSDDMPSHIKMALTRSSETIPFVDGRLLLGTWQGLFLWEHRDAPHRRELVVTVTGA
ncbi:MAG: secondary thiamine-phosphate synthase enzyme YjbQ [Planctomycetota bacterium]